MLAGAGGENPAEVANERVGRRKSRAAGEEPHRDGWPELCMAAVDTAALTSLTDPADRLDRIAESLKPFTASRLPAHQMRHGWTERHLRGAVVGDVTADHDGVDRAQMP